MKEFQKPSKKSNMLHSPIILLLFAVFLVIFLSSIIGLIRKNHETAKNKEMAELEHDKLTAQYEDLNSETERIKSDRGKEDIIREKFGVVKKGEGLVVVIDEDPSLRAAAASSHGNFLDFLKKIFSKKKVSSE
jgi:cell division protein FtsB